MKKPTIKKKPGSSPSDVAYDAATFLRCDGRARRAARGVAERHLHEAESETSRRRLRRQSVRSVLFFLFCSPFGCFRTDSSCSSSTVFLHAVEKGKDSAVCQRETKEEAGEGFKKKKDIERSQFFFLFFFPLVTRSCDVPVTTVPRTGRARGRQDVVSLTEKDM